MTEVRVSEKILFDGVSIANVLSGGDRESFSACIDLWKEGKKVDPDDFLEGLSNLLALDTLNIWDHDITVFYKEVCKGRVMYMAALLRANQIGQISDEFIQSAIVKHGEGIDLDSIVEAVKATIPNFRTDIPGT